jgi:hypothetical protein
VGYNGGRVVSWRSFFLFVQIPLLAALLVVGGIVARLAIGEVRDWWRHD